MRLASELTQISIAVRGPSALRKQFPHTAGRRCENRRSIPVRRAVNGPGVPCTQGERAVRYPLTRGTGWGEKL